MSGEVVSVHFGGSGIRVAEKLWKKRCNDFGVDLSAGAKNTHEFASTFFKKGSDDKYRPRCVMADLVSNDLDHIKSFDMKELFNHKLMKNANVDNGCWADGHYTDGAEIICDVLDNTRKEAETSDNFKGFEVYGSLSGGAGGLLTLASVKLFEEFPDKAVIGFHGLLNSRSPSSCIEPYNVLLALNA